MKWKMELEALVVICLSFLLKMPLMLNDRGQRLYPTTITEQLCLLSGQSLIPQQPHSRSLVSQVYHMLLRRQNRRYLYIFQSQKFQLFKLLMWAIWNAFNFGRQTNYIQNVDFQCHFATLFIELELSQNENPLYLVSLIYCHGNISWR